MRQIARGSWVHNRRRRKAGDTRRGSFAGLNRILASKSTHRPMIVFGESKGNVEPEYLLSPLTRKSCMIRTAEPMGARMLAGVYKVLGPLTVGLGEQPDWGAAGIVEFEHVLSLGRS